MSSWEGQYSRWLEAILEGWRLSGKGRRHSRRRVYRLEVGLWFGTCCQDLTEVKILVRSCSLGSRGGDVRCRGLEDLFRDWKALLFAGGTIEGCGDEMFTRLFSWDFSLSPWLSAKSWVKTAALRWLRRFSLG